MERMILNNTERILSHIKDDAEIQAAALEDAIGENTEAVREQTKLIAELLAAVKHAAH